MSHASGSASGSGELGLKDNVSRMGDNVQQIKEDFSGLAKSAGATAKSGVAAAKDTIQQGLSTAKEKGAQATEAVRDHITEHPLAAVGIAAGVGFLLGMLVCRPRN